MNRISHLRRPCTNLNISKRYFFNMGCTNSIELDDSHYYAAVDHDTISEKIVELGSKKNKRHIACWMPVSKEPKGIVVVS